MTRHVLLMLSTDEPPDPLAEVEWHARRSETHGETVVATTKLLGRLQREHSIVAFYGNSALRHRLLGYGYFGGFGRLDQPRGRQLLAMSELYEEANVPAGAQGAVVVKGFRLANPNATIDELKGTIESSGLPLTEKHLPPGPSRACVYFTR